jgi:predicted dehydrogenase
MQPLGVAVVGLGWWGRTIVPLLKGSDKLKVVCGVDVQAAALDGVRTLTSLEEALRDPEVQAVVLCTPHTLHTEQIIAAASAKKHVFCEKPLSLTRADVLRAVKACNDNEVVLAVGHEKRFEPPVQ